MKFSIIIPVRSINEYLLENIHHLKNLNYPDFEVIILTDAQEELKDMDDARFRFIAVGALGPGEKRNIGAQSAQGRVLAFLDDDAHPEPDWLNYAYKIFSEPNVYALGAPAMTPANVSFLEKMSGYILESPLTSGFTTYRHRPEKARQINDYPTVNMFVTKVAFDAVGGFSSEFWPGEDTKLCLDLVTKFNENFVYDPRPVVHHHRRELFKPHLKQISRYGRHRGQFARIFPGNSRMVSYFMPSAFVLGVFIGPIVCILFPLLWSFYFAVLFLYFSLLTIESSLAAKKAKNLTAFYYIFVGILATHVVYGINFIWGFIKRPKLQLRGVDEKTGNYIGG